MKSAMIFSVVACNTLSGVAIATHLDDRLAAVHDRFLEDRRESIPSLSDPFGVPDAARVVIEMPSSSFQTFFEWKRNVVATVFWIGELPSENNPSPNTKSAWDENWQAHFGGYDKPDQRNGYLPAGFSPNLNPFYIALPYNDVGKDGAHRVEASKVIPWFWEAYRGDGISVCKDRWVEIHHSGKVCYAQWEDVGPFEVDHWQYVFGNEPPRPNRNQSAGIDLSPAVRDFLQLSSGDNVEWRFANDCDIPPGPWGKWSSPSESQKY
jgi:hypothetical protein